MAVSNTEPRREKREIGFFEIAVLDQAGSCMGDPMDCSRAGNVVRAATSLSEAITGLEGLGYEVTVTP